MDEELELAGPGRPRIELDLKMLEALAQQGATNREIALHFGVSERTIDYRRASDPVFLETMDRGVATGNISLRRKQMALALAGNVTMLIWLGKQRLGQKDKVVQEHSGHVEHAVVGVDLSDFSDQELDELERFCDKAVKPREGGGAGRALEAPAPQDGQLLSDEGPAQA